MESFKELAKLSIFYHIAGCHEIPRLTLVYTTKMCTDLIRIMQQIPLGTLWFSDPANHTGSLGDGKYKEFGSLYLSTKFIRNETAFLAQNECSNERTKCESHRINNSFNLCKYKLC